MSESRPYDALRTIVEKNGGTMTHEKQGHAQGGAWVVQLGEHRRVFASNLSGFPELDRLYVPKQEAPTHYSHYSLELTEGAAERFLDMIRGTQE